VLWAPERERLVDSDRVMELMPTFVEFFLTEVRGYFSKHLVTVDPDIFFQAIKGDDAFSFEQGRIVQSFKEEFTRLTTRG
jgi:hypothetical protein